jgi:hypothetical protein
VKRWLEEVENDAHHSDKRLSESVWMHP